MCATSRVKPQPPQPPQPPTNRAEALAALEKADNTMSRNLTAQMAGLGKSLETKLSKQKLAARAAIGKRKSNMSFACAGIDHDSYFKSYPRHESGKYVVSDELVSPCQTDIHQHNASRHASSQFSESSEYSSTGYLSEDYRVLLADDQRRWFDEMAAEDENQHADLRIYKKQGTDEEQREQRSVNSRAHSKSMLRSDQLTLDRLEGRVKPDQILSNDQRNTQFYGFYEDLLRQHRYNGT